MIFIIVCISWNNRSVFNLFIIYTYINAHCYLILVLLSVHNKHIIQRLKGLCHCSASIFDIYPEALFSDCYYST